jgi:ferric-dicitrate binding protein FerR (iron transport regulator)
MEIKDEHIELIAKYLSGQASEAEATLLLDWVNQAPEHAQVFKRYAADWQKHHFIAADPEHQWGQFSRRAGLKRFEMSARRKVWMRAAAFLILALLSVYAAMFLFNNDQKILVAGNEIKTFTLPDGSSLTLSPGSSASYLTSAFNKRNREIMITGMARLEVVHTEDNIPFEVMAGKLKVSVLGTKFYVNTGDESTMPMVYLEEGRVEASLEGDPGNKLVLNPGQQASIDPESGQLIIGDFVDINQTAWLTKHFEFNATPLFRVLWLLQKAYGIEIELVQPGIGNCTVTATFDKQEPGEILRIIAATLGLQLSGNAGHFVLSGNACP